MKELLTQLAISQAPSIISGLKSLYKQAHPDEQQPTDQDARDAYVSLFVSELATDDVWLAAHPNWNK